jgi:hypothetical protein
MLLIYVFFVPYTGTYSQFRKKEGRIILRKRSGKKRRKSGRDSKRGNTERERGKGKKMGKSKIVPLLK